MAHDLHLHYAPDNASLCIRLALETLDVPYQTVLVDRAAHAQKSPAFLLLNPNGLIPVLETPQGPVFETGAILLWLADRHGGLMPLADNPARAHALQWLFWLSNTLHPLLRMLFYPEQYMPDDPATLRLVTRKALAEKLTLLNTAEHAGWLDDDAMTAQGCYLAPMLRWCALYGGGPDWFALSQWPRLLAFAERMEKCPATGRAAQAEGLGDTPFSAPSPCHPPEGHAF